MLAIKRRRQEDDAGRGEDLQAVVDVVGEDRFVRRFEALDDLLVVLQGVPDALRGVDDVVEVDVQLLGRRDVHGALEVTEGDALRPHDAPEVDRSPASRWRCRARPLREWPSKISSSMRSSFWPILRSIGKQAIDGVVDDLVEEERGALLEVALAHLLALLAAGEERVDGLELIVGHGDEVVRAHEEVDLHHGEAVAVAVEARELQDHEDVVVVAVDLGPLVARVDVLVVERVEARSAPPATPGPTGAAWGCGSSGRRCW